MDKATARERLEYSAAVLLRWEPMGLPSCRAVDNLRMISEEVAILGQMGVEHPALFDEASALMARYRALAEKMRIGMN